MNTNILRTLTVPTNVRVTFVASEENRMVRHLETQAALRELLAAITRWYYTAVAED